jgi:hypothetical protein
VAIGTEETEILEPVVVVNPVDVVEVEPKTATSPLRQLAFLTLIGPTESQQSAGQAVATVLRGVHDEHFRVRSTTTSRVECNPGVRVTVATIRPTLAGEMVRSDLQVPEPCRDEAIVPSGRLDPQFSQHFGKRA